MFGGVRRLKLTCPREKCFNWRSPGTLYAHGLHEILDDALSKLQAAPEEFCGWHLGVCIRKNKDGDGDFYEPNNPLPLKIAKNGQFRMKGIG